MNLSLVNRTDEQITVDIEDVSHTFVNEIPHLLVNENVNEFFVNIDQCTGNVV